MNDEQSGFEQPQIEEKATYDDVTANTVGDYGGFDEDFSSPVERSSHQTTESEQNSTATGDNSNEQIEPGVEEWDDPSDYEIEIGGQVFSFEDIMNWKEDADNKTDWNKSNTQKAQNLSQLGKLFKQMQGDSKLRDYVKDYYYDNPNGLKDAGLGEINWDEIPEDMDPQDYLIQDDQHNQLMTRVEQLEVDKNVQVLESQLEVLEMQYPDLLGANKTDEFLRFVDESGVGDLNVGFRLWATDHLLEQNTQNRQLDENRQRNSGRIIGSHDQGASNVVNDVRRYKGKEAWNQMDLGDPEIDKYFK